MADLLTVGLVGCGRWGRYILRDLVTLGCRVVVVARSDQSRENARAGGAWRTVARADELPDVAGVVVASPTVTHFAVTRDLLARQVPVFVEKPLTCDAAGADELVRRAGERVFVMDKWRYHPGVEELGRLARSGELGPVVGLRTTRVGWGNPHTDVDAVWILAPHDLAIAREILGHVPTPRAAVAERVAGHATSLVGLLGDSPWHALEVSSRETENRRVVRLHCRDGVATLRDGYSAEVEVAWSGGPRDQEPRRADKRPVSTEMPLLRELRTFVDHLRGGPAPRSSAADGAAAVRAIEQLRRLAGMPHGPAGE